MANKTVQITLQEAQKETLKTVYASVAVEHRDERSIDQNIEANLHLNKARRKVSPFFKAVGANY